MLKKLMRYGKEMVLILFFFSLGQLLAKCKKEYKNVWLVCERGTDARDNGYWFYRYLKEQHPEINSRFVIAKNGADYAKIAALGGAVEYKSFRHYILYFAAKNLIGTHAQPCAPDKIMYYHLAQKGIHAKGKQIFLQHGITMNDMRWLDGNHFKADLFVCGAMPEYEHIHETYQHPNGVVQYLGLSRFDHLIQAERKEKMILVMPTWRGSRYPSGNAFLQTAYYQNFQSLLQNKELDQLLQRNGYTLIFYPHIEMQQYLGEFHTDSQHIITAGAAEYDVQELLMQCAMLITDYSSVFFDVAYLQKPIVYYQFDAVEFHSYHYKKGYFDFERDGFGPVCQTETELLAAIQNAFDRSMVSEPMYRERREHFFRLRDDRNCERIYDAICKLNKKTEENRGIYTKSEGNVEKRKSRVV